MEFRKQMAEYPVFSLEQIKRALPGFHRIQLDRWANKGYITKIRRGYYAMAEHPADERFLFYLSNAIYSPSYISLEKALQMYGIMRGSSASGEASITAVTTLKTARFKTPLGDFAYGHVREPLFWGYRHHDFGQHKILVAEPEKALLDFLYLNPRISAKEDFDALNLDAPALREHVNRTTLRRYLKAFRNKALAKRVRVMLKTTVF